MATYRSRTLWWSDLDGHFFDPLHSNIVPGPLPLIRQDVTRLRVQVCKHTDFALGSDLTAPAAAQVSLADYGNVVFALKTNDQFEDADDYTAVWSAFDTGDTAWHALANGRFSILIAPTSTIALALYASEFALARSGTLDWRLPLLAATKRQVSIGDETSLPAGVSVASGTATITAPADYVDVTYAGMTASGVVIASLLNSTEPTTLVVTPGSGTFRITAGAIPTTTYTVAYFVASV